LYDKPDFRVVSHIILEVLVLLLYGAIVKMSLRRMSYKALLLSFSLKELPMVFCATHKKDYGAKTDDSLICHARGNNLLDCAVSPSGKSPPRLDHPNSSGAKKPTASSATDESSTDTIGDVGRLAVIALAPTAMLQSEKLVMSLISAVVSIVATGGRHRSRITSHSAFADAGNIARIFQI
jgi:hypothetical protein